MGEKPPRGTGGQKGEPMWISRGFQLEAGRIVAGKGKNWNHLERTGKQGPRELNLQGGRTVYY